MIGFVGCGYNGKVNLRRFELCNLIRIWLQFIEIHGVLICFLGYFRFRFFFRVQIEMWDIKIDELRVEIIKAN